MSIEMHAVLMVAIAIMVGTMIAILLAKIFKSLIIAILAGLFICTMVTLVFGDGQEIVAVITSFMDEDTGKQIRDGYDYYKEKEESFGSSSGMKQPKTMAQDERTGMYYVNNVIQISFKDGTDTDTMNNTIETIGGHSFSYFPDTKVYEILIGEHNFQELNDLCKKVEQTDCIKSASHQVLC